MTFRGRFAQQHDQLPRVQALAKHILFERQGMTSLSTEQHLVAVDNVSIRLKPPTNQQLVRHVTNLSNSPVRMTILTSFAHTICFTSIHRMGTARAILQKAVAIGPVDASRTKMGANPIATAPAASKRNERVIVPYRSRPGDVQRRPRPSMICSQFVRVKYAGVACKRHRGTKTHATRTIPS